MRRVALAALALLALPSAASAHVSFSPPFVSAGVDTRLEVSVPNERPGHAAVAVTMTAPAGFEVTGSTAPPGWTATVDGKRVTWKGRALASGAVLRLGVGVIARVRAGAVPVSFDQRYDDGEVVRWTTSLSVLPAAGANAPAEHPWAAAAAGAVGLVVIVATLVGLRRLRRRSLQER